MGINEIKRLLEAFYNAETTPEEEKILLDYFKGSDVAGELIEEKELFIRLYEESQEVSIPAGLENRLENLIDELDAKESATRTAIAGQSNRRQLWKWAGSVAAGVAILVSAGLYFNSDTGITPPPFSAEGQTDMLSEADAQKVKEAQDALVLLSTKFNKGVDQLAVVSTNIEKTNQILNKTFSNK